MGDVPSFGELSMDEDERHVHDQLSRLIGSGPAAFFRDACRLVKQEPRLPSASNVLAHLIREIESAVEELLVDPTALSAGDEERCGACGALTTNERCEVCGSSRRATHRTKRQSVLRRWGVAEDDPMAAAWLAEDSLDKYAHRRGYGPPRPVDSNFLALWDGSKAALRWLLDGFENEFLTKLQPLVASAMQKGPGGGGLKDLTALPFTLISHRYMFLNLDSADWIEPLVKAGFYESPPGVAVDADGREYFPAWPQLDFLVRFADEQPDAVCNAVLAIPDTENPWVIKGIFEIAKAVPHWLAVRLVPRQCESLGHAISLPWYEAIPVIRRLRDADHRVEAVTLALAALKPSLESSGMSIDDTAEAIGLLAADIAPSEVKEAAEETLTRLRRQQWMAENTRAFAASPRSPLPQEVLDAMTVDELADYVTAWRPPDRSMDSPTERGLAESLCGIVDSRPQEIAEKAHSFADAPGEFAGWFLSAFRDAVRRGVTLPWESLITYMEAISQREGDDDSRWAKREAASLLEEAIRKQTSGLDQTCHSRVWQIIKRLAADSHPSPQDEKEFMHEDPFTYSLNCVRGKAVHALFAYLSWFQEELGDKRFRLAQHAPEVAAELERLLSPACESSLAVRAAIAVYWPWLHRVDEEWALSHANDIFPVSDGNVLRRAAWVACICWTQPSSSFYRAFRTQYLQAASELCEVEPDLFTNDYRRRFGEHIGQLMLWCLIDPRKNDEVLDAFLRGAPVTTRNSFIDFLGRSLMTVRGVPAGSEGGISEEALNKLAFLIEQRLDAATEEESELSEELEGFGQWFASSLFDDEWSLKCLAMVASSGGKIERPDLLGKRLATLLAEYPRLVLESCEALLEGQSALFVFRGRPSEIVTILEAAEASGDPVIVAAGGRLRSRLVARGYIGYGIGG